MAHGRIFLWLEEWWMQAPLFSTMNAPSALNDITVVSVTYRSRALVQEMALALERFPHIIFVDNASNDGTVEALSSAMPHAQVLSQQSNVGFGPGNNAGLTQVTTPFVLFLNPDCVITPESANALVATLKKYPLAVMAGPVVLDAQGQPNTSFKWGITRPLPPSRLAYPYPQGEVSAPNIDGACMMANVALFRQIGAFSPELFMYFEEDDIGLRAISKGMDIISTPFAQAVHRGGMSSTPSFFVNRFKSYHLTRSRLLMHCWYMSKCASLAIAFRIVLSAILALPVFFLLGQMRHVARWVGRLQAAFLFLASGTVLRETSRSRNRVRRLDFE
jgi:N-acetylglucosaminyl-diphospho-decaprenol L-rhamnosyltransferase